MLENTSVSAHQEAADVHYRSLQTSNKENQVTSDTLIKEDTLPRPAYSDHCHCKLQKLCRSCPG